MLSGRTLASGGILSGSYTLPPLTDCGAFTSLISAAASGSGNTVTLTLTSR
ncbi:MAG TPA: hypothetical protein VG317_21655 [Pseudonocardiaceae bacterium]|nr:hypothetical protein [Pseudonocardiaceae bacterium]